MEALKTLHWLPIQQRIEYKILTTIFKCIKGTAPQYLQDLIQLKENRQPKHEIQQQWTYPGNT